MPPAAQRPTQAPVGAVAGSGCGVAAGAKLPGATAGLRPESVGATKLPARSPGSSAQAPAAVAKPTAAGARRRRCGAGGCCGPARSWRILLIAAILPTECEGVVPGWDKACSGTGHACKQEIQLPS
mmetsp:Transcript_71182/g.208622  ORF Transcript_71182/g.208622 Transcript_71182/m.208622 type:complete len:126 (+) Transcript_71182:336-713(+)